MPNKIKMELVSLEKVAFDPAAELFAKELRALVNKHNMWRFAIVFQTKKGNWGRMIQPEVGAAWNMKAIDKLKERVLQMIEKGVFKL